VSAQSVRHIIRYSIGERLLHWTVAISFVLAALSGLALFHPALFWLTQLFGGGPWMRVLHPFIGLIMVGTFIQFAAKYWKDNALQAHDWEWLRKIKDVIENKDDRLPEVGRYNAGQKLLYFTIVACLAILLLSGIVIWRVYFAEYFSIGLIRLAALSHAFFAFLLIIGIIVHVVSAIWIKGSIRAMTRGWVTLGWAWKHHRAWFREVTKQR
jgi:formate dehydrogenase subunit gamma